MDEGAKSMDSAVNVGLLVGSLDVARDDIRGEGRDDMGTSTTTMHLPKKALRRGA